jgi:hypothetical protein
MADSNDKNHTTSNGLQGWLPDYRSSVGTKPLGCRAI